MDRLDAISEKILFLILHTHNPMEQNSIAESISCNDLSTLDSTLEFLRNEGYIEEIGFKSELLPSEQASLVHRTYVYRITPLGRVYCANIKLKREDRLRLWFVAIVAFLALVLSVISLTWQIYTWKSEKSVSMQLPSLPKAITAADCRPSIQ